MPRSLLVIGKLIQMKAKLQEISTGCTLTSRRARTAEAWQTILLVEDEAFVREVTCEVLESAGYVVLKARNAAEAMRTYRRHRGGLHLLLTDVVMPGKNGHLLAREIRNLCPGIKIIFVSGYAENPVLHKKVADPRAFYLPKPFSVESLVNKVKQALDGHQASASLARMAKRAGSSG